MNVVLSQITKFIQVNSNTNMIILGIPHRHELTYHSILNTEIHIFNRKLTNIIKHFEHTLCLECNSQSVLYTRHGMHLNAVGKETISKQTASQIYKSVGNKK